MRLTLSVARQTVASGLLDRLVHTWHAVRRDEDIDTSWKAHALFRCRCRRVDHVFARSGSVRSPRSALCSSSARVQDYSLTAPAETRFFHFRSSNYSRREKITRTLLGPLATSPEPIEYLLLTPYSLCALYNNK